ncbi:unnamed protein product [Arabidopsis halleri]
MKRWRKRCIRFVHQRMNPDATCPEDSVDTSAICIDICTLMRDVLKNPSLSC